MHWKQTNRLISAFRFRRRLQAGGRHLLHLRYGTADAMIRQRLMYLCSLTKTDLFGSGQTQRHQSGSHTAGSEITLAFFPELHPVLHDVLTSGGGVFLPPVCRLNRTPYVHVCVCVGGLCVSTVQLAHEATDCAPAASPRRAWLASLFRTQTSSSICALAPQLHWWATTSFPQATHPLFLLNAFCGEIVVRTKNLRRKSGPPLRPDCETNVCSSCTVESRRKSEYNIVVVGYIFFILFFPLK